MKIPGLYRRLFPIIFMIVIYLPLSTASADIAAVSITPTAIIWQPQVGYAQITLTVSGPESVSSDVFPDGVSPALYASDLVDGSYNYELTVTPYISDTVKAELMEARESGDMSIVNELKRSGVIPQEPMQQSGHFRIMNGVIVVDNIPED